MAAAAMGQAPCLRVLLESGRSMPEAVDEVGRTALTHAAQESWQVCVSDLLRVSDVNWMDSLGFTPLIRVDDAVMKERGSAHIVKEMLRAGADPDSEGPAGEVAVVLAARSGYFEAALLLAAVSKPSNVRKAADVARSKGLESMEGGLMGLSSQRESDEMGESLPKAGMYGMRPGL